MTSHRPAASVVVPSYQAAGHIRTALQALVTQKTSIAYEIIVVDSSTDGTDRIVREEFPQVRLLQFEHRCQVGTARNLGASAATGNVVLFVDTDTIPNPAWIDQMYGAIEEFGADAAGGSMSNGTPWSITGSAGFYLEFFRFLEYNSAPYTARFLVGGNSAFRKEVLNGVEYLDHPGGEDLLVSSNLARQGKKLLFMPRASVLHRNRTGFATLMRYQYMLGGGAFLYRSVDSPRRVRLLQTVPPLVFLMPFGVMAWIGATLLRRRRFADFLRFAVTLPVCLVANLSWALGFYRAMRQAEPRAIPATARNRTD